MFKNLSIKTKLVLLVLFPLLVSIYLVSQIIYEDNIQLKNLHTLNEVLLLSQKASALVHELQKERGATAGYLGTKGKSFKDVLAKQRKLTNKRKKIFLSTISSLDLKSINQDLYKQISEATKELSRLNLIRQKVDNFSISVKEAISYYTNLNSELLDAINTGNQLSIFSDLTKQLTAYMNLLQMKERMGIERAVGTGAISRGYFKVGELGKFSILVAEQHSFLREFMNNAG
jgi:methyl-accepting chemotaxis protein